MPACSKCLSSVSALQSLIFTWGKMTGCDAGQKKLKSFGGRLTGSCACITLPHAPRSASCFCVQYKVFAGKSQKAKPFDGGSHQDLLLTACWPLHLLAMVAQSVLDRWMGAICVASVHQWRRVSSFKNSCASRVSEGQHVGSNAQLKSSLSHNTCNHQWYEQFCVTADQPPCPIA